MLSGTELVISTGNEKNTAILEITEDWSIKAEETFTPKTY